MSLVDGRAPEAKDGEPRCGAPVHVLWGSDKGSITGCRGLAAHEGQGGGRVCAWHSAAFRFRDKPVVKR